eukprot:116706_1
MDHRLSVNYNSLALITTDKTIWNAAVLKMLLLFIVYLVILMATKRCSAQSIRDKIDIDTVVNTSHWWAPFLTEYHEFGAEWDINQMPEEYDMDLNEYEFDGSADSLFAVDVLIKVMIDEQILINIRTRMVKGKYQIDHKYDELVEWLKHNDNNLLRRMKRYLTNAQHHPLKYLSVFIAGQLRLVIQNDKGSYSVTNQLYYRIIARIRYFLRQKVTRSRNKSADKKTILRTRRANAWKGIKSYRSIWNSFHSNNGTVSILNIAKKKKDKNKLLFDMSHSILTHFAVTRHDNITIWKDQYKYNEISDKLSELQENEFEYKHGPRGAYDISLVMKTLNHCSSQNIATSNWKAYGTMYYEFAPAEITELMPPLMSANCIKAHQYIAQDWYCDKINEEVLVSTNPVVNGASDVATLSGSIRRKV